MELKRVYKRTDTIVEADDEGIKISYNDVYEDILVDNLFKRLIKDSPFLVLCFLLMASVYYGITISIPVIQFLLGMICGASLIFLIIVIKCEKEKYD